MELVRFNKLSKKNKKNILEFISKRFCEDKNPNNNFTKNKKYLFFVLKKHLLPVFLFDFIENRLEKNNYFNYAVFDNNNIVGFTNLQVHKNIDRVDMFNIFINPNFRGKNYGYKTILALINKSNAFEVSKLKLGHDNPVMSKYLLKLIRDSEKLNITVLNDNKEQNTLYLNKFEYNEDIYDALNKKNKELNLEDKVLQFNYSNNFLFVKSANNIQDIGFFDKKRSKLIPGFYYNTYKELTELQTKTNYRHIVISNIYNNNFNYKIIAKLIDFTINTKNNLKYLQNNEFVINL